MTLTRADIERAVVRAGTPSSDFDLNDPGLSRPKPRLAAGVLVPLIQRGSNINLVLTKRAAHLKSHPGQVAFPGGKVDEGDADITATALREAWEEIGLPPERVFVLGALPAHDTVTSFSVTPVVGWIDQPWQVKTDPGEVAEVFEVPLDFVLTKENFQVQGRHWQGHYRRYYAIPFGPYYIWGATARILRGLADQVQP